MGNSPILSQKTDLLSYEVYIGGNKVAGMQKPESKLDSIQHIEVKKEINRISTAEVYILDGDLAAQKFEVLDKNKYKPGEDIIIKAGYHQKNEVIFEGIIINTGVKFKDKVHSLLYVECADKAIMTTSIRRSNYFKDKTDSEAIEKVLSQYEVEKDIKGTDYKHKMLVQYFSTDWDFIVSRAEVNGHIVLTDQNKVTIKSPMDGSENNIELTYGLDFIKSDIHLNGWTQYNKVKCLAWDMTKQEVIEKSASEPNEYNQGSMKGPELANKFYEDPHEFHTDAPLEGEMLKVWADAKLLKSRFSRITGTIVFQGHAKVNPNDLLTVKKIGNLFDNEAYISSVQHMIEHGNWTTEVKLGMNPKWFSETQSTVTVTQASGLLPGIQGLHIGVVKKIHDDPDGQNRILVDVPNIEPSGKGIWARIASFYATDEAGSFFMPEETDEVILGFLQEDPRYPVILGSLYSKDKKKAPDPPKAPDADNSIKSIVTKNQLKIIFEDKDKNMILETPDGRRITLSDKDKEILIEDSFKNFIKMDNSGIEINSSKDIKIVTSTGNINIEAGQNIKGEASMNLEVKGTMSAKVEGNMLNLKGNVSGTLDGGATTTVKGGILFLN